MQAMCLDFAQKENISFTTSKDQSESLRNRYARYISYQIKVKASAIDMRVIFHINQASKLVSVKIKKTLSDLPKSIFQLKTRKFI